MVAAFVVEDASREVVNELRSGASAVFPQGLIHYQQNLGCETAEYVISYNAESPGTQVQQSLGVVLDNHYLPIMSCIFKIPKRKTMHDPTLTS